MPLNLSVFNRGTCKTYPCSYVLNHKSRETFFDRVSDDSLYQRIRRTIRNNFHSRRSLRSILAIETLAEDNKYKSGMRVSSSITRLKFVWIESWCNWSISRYRWICQSELASNSCELHAPRRICYNYTTLRHAQPTSQIDRLIIRD